MLPRRYTATYVSATIVLLVLTFVLALTPEGWSGGQFLFLGEALMLLVLLIYLLEVYRRKTSK